MKVLFLDIDGVLNSAAWFRTSRGPGTIPPSTDEGYTASQIDPAAIARLNRIIEETRCNVVISSTWRRVHSFGEILRAFRTQGFKHWSLVIGVTPVLDRPIGSGGLIAAPIRGDEIKAWLNAPGNEADKFVILDDDADMGDLKDHLIQTSNSDGLTDELAKKSIDRFNLKSVTEALAELSILGTTRPGLFL